MDAIIYNFGGGEGADGRSVILQPWTPTACGDGFDSASMRVDYRGTGDELVAAYALGTQSDKGSAMYYSGVQIERVAFGWTTGTVFAKGFWSSDRPNSIAATSTSYRERLWPFENGGDTYYISGKTLGRPDFADQIFNSQNRGLPFRARQILYDGLLERQGYEIITTAATEWTGPPKVVNIEKPKGMGTTPPNLKDPLISTQPAGWQSQGCQTNVVAVLGKVTLLSWRDSWKYIEKESE